MGKEDCGPNGNRPSSIVDQMVAGLPLISSVIKYIHWNNFDILVLLPDILNFPHF